MTEIIVQQPSGGPDVTRRNRRGDIYMFGDEVTDGSIRFAVKEVGEHIKSNLTHIELREEGTWNLTGLQLSGASLHLGFDMQLESQGDFLQTFNPSEVSSEHSLSLLPHTVYRKSGANAGTGTPHTPIVDKVIIEDFVTDPVSEVINTTIGQFYDIIIPQIIQTLTLQNGTVSATSNVTFTIYRGTDNTGSVIESREFPPSMFQANQPLVITLGSVAFSDNHPNIFLEFLSVNSLSLKTDSAGDVLMSAQAQELRTRDLFYDDLCLSNELDLTFSNELDLTYSNQFPTV